MMVCNPFKNWLISNDIIPTRLLKKIISGKSAKRI